MSYDHQEIGDFASEADARDWAERNGLELRDLHLRGLRGYADGGLVGNVRIPQIQLGDATSRSSSSNTLNLTIDGSAMSGKIDDDFAEKITAFMRKAALKGGKR